MHNETTPTITGQAARSQREEDEVVLRLPRPGRLLRYFLPAETVTHLRHARREQLLAVRSLIDKAIERIDTAEREGSNRTVRRTEIKIE